MKNTAPKQAASVENVFKLEGRVPLGKAIPFGLQHAMIAAGIASLIQMYPIWRVGSGLPVIMGVSFTFVARSFGGCNDDFGSWKNLLIAFITLCTCLAWNALAKGYLKQISVLVGMIVGYVLVILLDVILPKQMGIHREEA